MNHSEPAGGEPEPAVEVVRSARRRRTVSAHRAGDRIVVSVPARISRAEEARWVALMVARVLASERKQRPSDEDLLVRAAGFSLASVGIVALRSAGRLSDLRVPRATVPLACLAGAGDLGGNVFYIAALAQTSLPTATPIT